MPFATLAAEIEHLINCRLQRTDEISRLLEATLRFVPRSSLVVAMRSGHPVAICHAYTNRAFVLVPVRVGLAACQLVPMPHLRDFDGGPQSDHEEEAPLPYSRYDYSQRLPSYSRHSQNGQPYRAPDVDHGYRYVSGRSSSNGHGAYGRHLSTSPRLGDVRINVEIRSPRGSGSPYASAYTASTSTPSRPHTEYYTTTRAPSGEGHASSSPTSRTNPAESSRSGARHYARTHAPRSGATGYGRSTTPRAARFVLSCCQPARQPAQESEADAMEWQLRQRWGCFAVLGLGRHATSGEIRAAYRRLVMEHHPDRNGGEEDAHRRFLVVGKAFEVLGDEGERGLYEMRRGLMLGA